MSSELGRLLKLMIETLKARRGRAMQDTLENLGDVISISPDAIRKWLQGRHKPDSDRLARLVEIGVLEAGMDRHWAERILYLGEQPERIAILNRLFPTIESQRVRHNLPRRPYMRLIDREEELEEAMRRLAPESRHWLVPIEGIGGVGKSALALEIGWRFVEGYDRLPSGRRFNAVVWASAKQEVLTTGGITLYPSTLTNLTDVYRAIAEVLEWPAILRVSAGDQRREVEKALRQAGPVLIILDN